MNRVQSIREAVNLLTLMRQHHNLENPNAPIYGKDIAAYVGCRSKSTITNYESGFSSPSHEALSKMLEFWGLGLFIGPLEEDEEHE